MKQPIAIYSSWVYSLPQIFVMALITFTILNIFPKNKFIVPFAISLSVFFIYTYMARFVLASEHRKGMSALSKSEFDVAITHFEKSYEFFTSHQWLDKFRSVTFMSPSVWSYREMALMNVAATYSMKKDAKKYREANERLLREYPNNKRARDALEFLDAMKNEA